MKERDPLEEFMDENIEEITNSKETLNDGLNELQIYEIGYHILPTVADGDLAAEVSKIHGLITKAGGTVLSDAFPEVVNLAYEISKRTETKQAKFNRAYFGWVKFEVERANLAAIEAGLKANPQVLRFLTVKTVKENTLYVPKVMSVRREEVAPETLVSSTEERTEKTPASEEEIDKSIDELVIS